MLYLPGRCQGSQHGGEPAGRLDCAGPAAVIESSAVSVAQEEPQVGGSPVSGDEPCRAHQCDSRSTLLPLDPTRKSRSQPRSAWVTCSIYSR